MTRAEGAIPAEGFYWSVSQYQIARLELKQELRAIAAGATFNAEDLSRRAAVMASRASILTEPSDLRTLLSGVPGYLESAGRVAELQRRIGPVLRHKRVQQSDAQWVLAQFDAVQSDGALSRLASEMRTADVRGKEDLLRELRNRLTWVWIGFALCWGSIALWTLNVLRSRRRYARAASDRAQAIDAMERAIEVKRRFLSMVSHEVRSPVQSIVTAAESLAHEIGLQGNRLEGLAALRRLRHSVSALQGQLRDLLTLANSDSESPGTQVETFELGALVQDVCTSLEDLAAAKGLTFYVGVPNLPLAINADPIRIAQVLRNLVENAVRYTVTGGITVHVWIHPPAGERPVEPGRGAGSPSPALLHQRDIQLEVHDTGPGLPPQALQQLQSNNVAFEPGRDGTRVGLYVVRDVLTKLGGTLTVHSAPGVGTECSVTIPVQRVAEPSAPALVSAPGASEAHDEDDATAPRVQAEVLRVLVVDDRQEILSALSEQISRLGHVCDTALSAAHAHPLLASINYDTVLIDLQMPGEDGLALATAIRKLHARNSQTMLILISAAENRAVGLTSPFDGFLEKPISSAALEALIGSRTPR